MSHTTPTSAPAGPRSRAVRTLFLVIAFVVVLGGGVLVGRYALPAGGGQAEPGQSPSTNATSGSGAREHGPTKITKGVPSGFTRDREGAASAAMIAVQLQPNIARGYADVDVVKSTWLASNADEATRQVFSQRGATTGDDQTTKLPADVTVKDFTDTEAVVEVWVSSAGIAPGLGGRGVTRSQSFSTVTYRLAWQNNDWKVVTFKTSEGPRPGTDASAQPPARKQVAFYTFFLTIE